MRTRNKSATVKEEDRLRKLRNMYRNRYHQERARRKVSDERAKEYADEAVVLRKQFSQEKEEIVRELSFSNRRLRQLRNAVVVAAIVICGIGVFRWNPPEKESAPVPTSTSTESHILASLKMDCGCSATVVGDPIHFREYDKILIVSAAHCVSSEIGETYKFFNPDKSQFSAKLIAVDRDIDASLFLADPDDVIGAVFMIEPGQFGAGSSWSACNYPADSGGPNYKICNYIGESAREGANKGFAFSIDQVSRDHHGYHWKGGSGGGMFVRPENSTEWRFYAPTTHGIETGDRVITGKSKDLFEFISKSYPCDDDDDCPWCPRKRKQCPRKKPQDQQPDQPPWYNPNIPIEPPKGEVPPPPGEPPAPQPPPGPDVTVLESKIQKLEIEIKNIQSQSGTQGPKGDKGDPGEPGKTPELDHSRIENQVQTIVNQLVASGQLKGPQGEPGENAEIDLEKLTREVLGRLSIALIDPSGSSPPVVIKPDSSGVMNLPPVKMDLVLPDKSRISTSKPLGKPLVLGVNELVK